VSKPSLASPSKSTQPASVWAQSWARWRGAASELRFDPATEREFRQWYAHYVRPRVRAAVWLPLTALLLVLFAPGPFHDVRTLWFGENHSIAFNVLRFGVVLPTTLAIFVIAYSDLYYRHYVRAAQIVAPLHGLCFIAMDVMMRPQGYALSTWLVLVVLASYFMYGMLGHQGIRSAFIVLSAYVFMGIIAGLDSLQWRMDLAAITFGAVFAGYVFYSLHRAVRVNYIDHRRMNDRLRRDGLTGIHNRRMFDEHIERLWQQAMRERVALGLLIIDIDHFKDYNDSLGHQAGDECLSKIANLLAAGARRPLDLAARYGGEEFAIVLYATDRRSIEELSEQLQAQIAATALAHPASPVRPYVTVSIGGACVVPSSGRSQFGFIQLADEALYAAKERGRNRVVIMDQEYESLQTGAFRSYRVTSEAMA
jgi:diguanylate cyclase (GGDEF)-like protein